MGYFRNTGQPDWDWWSKLWPAPGETLRALGIREGNSVAEICCGNGYFALPAARIVDPDPVYAVDVDDSLLSELAELADLQRIENLVPIHGDVRRLASLLPERVDVIVLANSFHGIDDHEGVLQEVVESLREGGRFVVVNWHDQPREETIVSGVPRGPPTDLRLSPAETERIVVEAVPLEAVERVDLPPYHYGIVFERYRDWGR